MSNLSGYIFEELSRPVVMEATFNANVEGVETSWTWKVKFKRPTEREVKQYQKAARKKMARMELRHDASPAEMQSWLDAVASLQETLDTSRESAFEHLVGFELPDGQGGLIPETPETLAWVKSEEAQDKPGIRELKDSVFAAWQEFMNPARKAVIKNSKASPENGPDLKLATQ